MRFAAITDLHFGRAEPFRGVHRKLTGQAPALFSPADQDLTGQFWFDDSPAGAFLATRAELRSLLAKRTEW